MRRARVRKRAVELLESLSGKEYLYEEYRALYGLWCVYNAAVPELRPLFRIPGIEPDGRLSITAEFSSTVRRIAGEILPEFSDVESEDR